MNIHHPVYLKQNKKVDPSPMDLLHDLLEKYVFWRLSTFKNKPRGNFLFVRSILVVLSVFILGLFIIALVSAAFSVFSSFTPSDGIRATLTIENLIKLIVGYFSANTISYWNMNSLFNKKWTYCCQLYNKIIELEVSNGSKNHLENSFAIDLLTLDLWAHRSFADFFAEELERCINLKYQDQGLIHDWITRVNKNEITEDDAWEILNYGQSNIVSISRSPDGTNDDSKKLLNSKTR